MQVYLSVWRIVYEHIHFITHEFDCSEFFERAGKKTWVTQVAIHCAANTIELGLNVIDNLRGQGIGTRIMHELIDLGHKHFPDRELHVCVRKDNIPSIHVAEKNGGILISKRMTPEAEIIKKALGESNTWVPKPKERDIRYMQDAVRDSTDAVLIYKV